MFYIHYWIYGYKKMYVLNYDFGTYWIDSNFELSWNKIHFFQCIYIFKFKILIIFLIFILMLLCVSLKRWFYTSITLSFFHIIIKVYILIIYTFFPWLADGSWLVIGFLCSYYASLVLGNQCNIFPQFQIYSKTSSSL